MRSTITLFILTTVLLLSACGPTEDTGDILFHSLKIYDGTGSEPFVGDVIVENDKIKRIGEHLKCSTCKLINGNGRSLSPGFIDLHAHLEPLPLIPSAESAIHMGVTTALGGPDGSSPINLRTYLDTLEAQKVGINVGYLIGHNSVRSEVMQLAGRAPTEEELDKMKEMREKMEGTIAASKEEAEATRTTDDLKDCNSLSLWETQ